MVARPQVLGLGLVVGNPHVQAFLQGLQHGIQYMAGGYPVRQAWLTGSDQKAPSLYQD